jgi:hypothetical protein
VARPLVKKTDAGKSRAQWMPFVRGIPLIAVVVPFVFWIEFGHVGTFAIAFTVGLVLLLALIAFGLWNLERTEAKNRRGRP